MTLSQDTGQEGCVMKYEIATVSVAGVVCLISDGPTSEDVTKGENEWEHKGGAYGHKAPQVHVSTHYFCTASSHESLVSPLDSHEHPPVSGQF